MHGAMTDDHLYRRGVGVMLLNAEGQVWVGRRIDNTDEAWQMPQGGIDKGEEPWATALRELEEETGIAPHLVERIADCPERLQLRPARGASRQAVEGQVEGPAARTGICPASSAATATSTSPPSIPSSATGNGSSPAELPDLIVPFKRDLYRRLLRRASA